MYSIDIIIFFILFYYLNLYFFLSNFVNPCNRELTVQRLKELECGLIACSMK